MIPANKYKIGSTGSLLRPRHESLMNGQLDVKLTRLEYRFFLQPVSLGFAGKRQPRDNLLIRSFPQFQAF